jgi:hypothetical protein
VSIWPDVVVDRASAQSAAELLRRTAAELDTLADDRATLASRAQVGWSGTQRDRFDQQLTVAQEATGMLVADLLAAAGVVEDSLEVAADDQRRRLDAREQWRAERDAERVDRQVR